MSLGSAFYNNPDGGVKSPTPQVHVPQFDYEILPGQPSTQYQIGPIDPLAPPKSKESKQQLSTPWDNYVFSVLSSGFVGVLFATIQPEMVYTETRFWVFTAATSAVVFVIQEMLTKQK
jgi:hypothetical protein